MNYNNIGHNYGGNYVNNDDYSGVIADIDANDWTSTVVDTDASNIARKISQIGKSRDKAALYNFILPYLNKENLNLLEYSNSLHWVCYCCTPQIVEMLLNLGMNIEHADNLNMETPIFYAIKGANFQVVRYIINNLDIDYASNINNRGMTLLLVAAAEYPEGRHCDILQILEFLYLKGISLEAQDREGNTALFWAAKRGSMHLLQWMLSHGANMNHRDIHGNTVLHVAALSALGEGSDECISFICEKGGINLLDARNTEGLLLSDIVTRRRKYFMSLALFLHSMQFNLFGFVRIFRSPYAFYYWICTCLNLVTFYFISNSIYYESTTIATLLDVWVWLWLISQLSWVICFASDPGYVLKQNIDEQFFRVSKDFHQDQYRNGTGNFEENSAQYQLQLAELGQLQLNGRIIRETLLHNNYKKNFFFNLTDDQVKLCSQFGIEAQNTNHQGFVDTDGNYVSPNDAAVYQGRKKHDILYDMNKLKEKQQKYYLKLAQLCKFVAVERQNELPQKYISSIINGTESLKIICVTCKIVKPIRVHHCAECARCLTRQDHHCVWVDNCIAKNNFRSFWVFLFSLMICICIYYVIILYYLKTYIYIPSYFLLTLTSIVLAFTNVTWLIFVSYLFLRTTRSILTNVTFYEFFKKPEHIRVRFKNQTSEKCWDFQDLDLTMLVNNVMSFWSTPEILDEFYRRMLSCEFGIPRDSQIPSNQIALPRLPAAQNSPKAAEVYMQEAASFFAENNTIDTMNYNTSSSNGFVNNRDLTTANSNYLYNIGDPFDRSSLPYSKLPIDAGSYQNSYVAEPQPY